MEYLSEVKKSQCTARVVAYSISNETNERVITYELDYPRIIHSELLTHRLFSRNAASSRAIPVKAVVENVIAKAAMPVRFGANQSGMQDKGESINHPVAVAYAGMGEDIHMSPEEAWQYFANVASKWAENYAKAGYHKQVASRLVEPYVYMKSVVTFTGVGSNWFGLRDHGDADPTIAELTQVMKEAEEMAPCQMLDAGDWHLPYYGKFGVFIKGEDYGLEQAKRISASCCAQVSFRKLDDSPEKADKVFERLVESKPVHASPTEHQCTPLKKGVGFRSPYVTHIDRGGNPWSGNFRNWGQMRQVIDGNVIPDPV